MYVLIKNRVGVDCPVPKLFEEQKNDSFLFNQKTGKFLHQIVATLTEGEAFGEMGILTGGVRLASILTSEKCELAVIDSDVFKRLVQPQIQSQVENKIQFIRRLFSPIVSKMDFY